MSGWLVRRTDHDQLRDQDGMHSLLRGSISTTWPLTSTFIGGGDRNRTGVQGFAAPSLRPEKPCSTHLYRITDAALGRGWGARPNRAHADVKPFPPPSSTSLTSHDDGQLHVPGLGS